MLMFNDPCTRLCSLSARVWSDVKKLAIIVSMDPMAVRLKKATHASWPAWPSPKNLYACKGKVQNKVDVMWIMFRSELELHKSY